MASNDPTPSVATVEEGDAPGPPVHVMRRESAAPPGNPALDALMEADEAMLLGMPSTPTKGTSSGDFFDDPLLTRLSSGYGNTDKSATQLLEGLVRAAVPEDMRPRPSPRQRYDWNTNGLFNFSALEGILRDISQALQQHEVQITRLNNGAANSRPSSAKVAAGKGANKALEQKVEALTRAVRTIETRQVQLVERLDVLMRRGPLTPTHSFKGSPKLSPKASSKVVISDAKPTSAELPPAGAPEAEKVAEEGEGALKAEGQAKDEAQEAEPEDLFRTLKLEMGLGSEGSQKRLDLGSTLPQDAAAKDEQDGAVDQGMTYRTRRERDEIDMSNYVEERTYHQSQAEIRSQLSDLTLALTRLHKRIGIAPTRQELSNVNEQMRQDLAGMKRMMDTRFADMTRHSDEVLSEDLRRLHVWMAEQEQSTRERHNAMVTRVDGCMRKDQVGTLLAECSGIGDQLIEIKDDLARNRAYMLLFERKAGINQWKELIKKRLTRASRQYFGRWVQQVKREKEFERVASELMRHVFRTLMAKLTGSAFNKWQKVIKEQKEEQERRERGREVMSRCLNAAGRKDIFKGFNHWKRAIFYEKQAEKREDLMELVDMGASDPVFVARMLVNEIQMIKSIDFVRQEESRKQDASRVTEGITYLVQNEVAKLRDEAVELRESMHFQHREVTEALEDHMRVLTEHNDKMKEIEKLLHEEMGSAADSLKRSISDTFTLFTDQVNLKIQYVEDAIEGIRMRITTVDGILESLPQQMKNNVMTLQGKVEDLEESMHKDVSSVAHRQELKHSELQGLISTLNHDLKGLQREHHALAKLHAAAMAARASEADGPDMAILGRACHEFESGAKEQNYLPPHLDENVIGTIGQYTQGAANWVAAQVDLGSLKRYIAAPSPHEIDDWEEWVASRRQAMLEDYLTAFEKHMRHNYSTSSGLRLEARTRFRNKFRDALTQALASKEQMTVVSSSRASRVPACVACDRPLTTKQTRPASSKPSKDSGPEISFGKHPASASVAKTVSTQQRLLVGPPPAPVVSGSVSSPISHLAHNASSSLSSHRRGGGEWDCETGPSTKHGTIEGRSGNGSQNDRSRLYNPNGNNFVMRGGFRMPRIMHISPQVLDRMASNGSINHHLDDGQGRLSPPWNTNAGGGSVSSSIESTQGPLYHEDIWPVPAEDAEERETPSALPRMDTRHSRPRTAPNPHM